MNDDEWGKWFAEELFPEPTRAQKIRAIIGIVLTIIIMIFVITSCAPEATQSLPDQAPVVQTYYDEQNDVVCYLYSGDISCVKVR